jgi:flagellar motility protein MotE (MotC chaperone)
MAASRPALSGVGLIVCCFFASAALRLTDDGWALAEGIGEAAAGAGAETAEDAGSDKDRLLEAIRQREAQLAAEEKRLADRKQTLGVAEAKLAEQLAAFEKAQKNLEETLAMADQAAERDIARMTTVYENMKPADAAQIFETMDVGFAAGLLARMRPDAAAAVLTGMKPETAYAVTLTIASRNAAVPTE